MFSPAFETTNGAASDTPHLRPHLSSFFSILN